jgi:putative transcriptional regulator
VSEEREREFKPSDWEQHGSTTDTQARALLLAVERDPEVMRRLLADRAA